MAWTPGKQQCAQRRQSCASLGEASRLDVIGYGLNETLNQSPSTWRQRLWEKAQNSVRVHDGGS
jgi:hypothetical protein